MSIFMNNVEYAPVIRDTVEVPEFSALEIYQGDYLNTESYTVTDGVIDKYNRVLVS